MAKKPAASALRVPKLLYRKAEAAFSLGISVRQIEYMLANRQLSATRSGNRVLIPAEEVQRAAELIIRSGMINPGRTA